MPNISFDIFFNEDIVNVTASRSQGSAPKVKPGWKTRTAPKLPKKQEPKTSAFAKPTPRITEVEDSEEEKPQEKKETPKKKEEPPKKKEEPKKQESKEGEKKKIPKLAPKQASKPKA